jgi:hypothetical protein
LMLSRPKHREATAENKSPVTAKRRARRKLKREIDIG